jgi:hypothetical protein
VIPDEVDLYLFWQLPDEKLLRLECEYCVVRNLPGRGNVFREWRPAPPASSIERSPLGVAVRFGSLLNEGPLYVAGRMRVRYGFQLIADRTFGYQAINTGDTIKLSFSAAWGEFDAQAVELVERRRKQIDDRTKLALGLYLRC